MSLYVESFLKKIKEEAPLKLDILIGHLKIPLSLMENSLAHGSLLRYKARLEGNDLILEIKHAYNHAGFNRLEVHSPGKSAQITCFHFGTIGLMQGKSNVEISQIVKFSGQGRSDLNAQKKEAVCEVFNREGLLVQEEGKAPKWHIGSYNNDTKEWLYGQSTTGFLRNFFKVALVMAHFRGDRGIVISLDNVKTKTIQTVNDYIDKNLTQSRYPEINTTKIIHPSIFNDYRDLCDEIGLKGEEYVYHFEKERLTRAGKSELAKKVKHVSKENCAAGYDILSYSEDGRYRYIECKATKGSSLDFEISANEWEKAKHYREQYYIYRINNALSNPALTIINDPYKLWTDNSISLIPTAYKLKMN